MDRKAFIKSLCLNTSSLMAVYCMGSVFTSCTSKSNDPMPNNGTNGGSNNGTGGNGGTSSKVDFTLDLTTNDFTALQNNGGFAFKDAVIIIKNNNGDYVALSKSCTHQGTTLDYEANNNRLHCSNHGSNFSLTGSVLTGPAINSLKVYKTTFDDVKKTLRVFED